MRVIVCGGRDYTDRRSVEAVLGLLKADMWTVVTGGAKGADTLAANVAETRGMDTDMFEADWDQYGRAAGPIRNRQMLEAGADLVVAFPGGRGTADMVRRAKAAGVPVLEMA